MTIELLQNDISFDNCNDFALKMNEVLLTLKEDLILDFKDVKYLDSSAIGQLIILNNKVNNMNLKVIMINLNKLISNVFKLGKLDIYFKIQ